MAPTQHSQFSASASARLLACPGSFELSRQLDDGSRKATIYSAEGTLAHIVAEACLHSGREPADYIGETRTADGFEFTINEDFAEAVQFYVDYVRGLRAMGYHILLEVRARPSDMWPDKEPLPIDLFGTADCVAFHPASGDLAVGDLKFGRGVAVDAQDNTQLLYYAAGAMARFGPVKSVSTTIIQPRAFHPDGPVRRATYSPEHVLQWARTVLYQGVERALADGGKTLSAGDHCRFCPVLPHCKAPAELTFQTAQAAFANTPIENFPAADGKGGSADENALPEAHLSDEKLAELLDKIEIIEPWLAAVRRLALERVEAGRPLDGWKLVPRRAMRRWGPDPQEVIDALTAEGYSESDLTETVLLSPAKVERKLGRAAYREAVEPLVVRRSSGNTLASEGDPRARIRSRRTAQEAFGISAANS